MRKVKAHLEFNMAKEINDNKKGFFFKYVNSNRKNRENVPLLNEGGARVH